MKYRHHKYIWSKPFGTVKHHWELIGPLGAVHFHAAQYRESDWSCGLEFHHTDACNIRDRAPDHINCPMTGGRCWHDGTSLYASEHLWPSIEAYFRDGDHDMIFRILEREADQHFADYGDRSEQPEPEFL